MKPWVAAVAAGTAGAAITVGLLAWRLKGRLEARVANIEAAAQGAAAPGGSLAMQAANIRYRIGADASAHATQLATRVAEDHIYGTFGLTPERIAGIQRLASVFGS